MKSYPQRGRGNHAEMKYNEIEGTTMLFNIMTTERKFDFGVQNQTINKAMSDIATNLVKSERSVHADCKSCYTVRENATDGKINGEKWADFMQMKFGKRLTSSTAMKYATVYSVYGIPENGILHDMWDNYPVGKLIILSPLEGDKHKKAKRDTKAFFYYVGLWKNAHLEKPYAEWEKKNEKTLTAIRNAESAGLTDVVEMLKATLTAQPAQPANVDEFDTIVYMGYESIRTMNDSAVKEMLQKYIADNLTEEEETAKADKEEKAAKAAPTKAAKAALDSMVAYIATLDSESVPDTFNKTIAILKEVCKASEKNEEDK